MICLLIVSPNFSPQFLPVSSRVKRGLLEQLQTAVLPTTEHLSEQPAVSHGLGRAVVVVARVVVVVVATKSLKLK